MHDMLRTKAQLTGACAIVREVAFGSGDNRIGEAHLLLEHVTQRLNDNYNTLDLIELGTGKVENPHTLAQGGDTSPLRAGDQGKHAKSILHSRFATLQSQFEGVGALIQVSEYTDRCDDLSNARLAMHQCLGELTQLRNELE